MTFPLCLGLDTSNYTTSVALFDGRTARNVGELLSVPEGGLGLRQSDALFQHIRQLPMLFARLREEGLPQRPLAAVGASTRPRAVAESYMPCFLAGSSQGQALAHTLNIPFYPCSHQQGHLAAAAWSAGRLELLDRPHLAWHLSGGTTELLYVEPEGHTVKALRIGGTTDISAGQLIDRTGVLLGLPFPAGKALDALYGGESIGTPFRVKLNDLTFSLSGMENKGKEMAQGGAEKERIARFVLDTVAETVRRTTAAALERYPGLPVLCSGGVASNSVLRRAMKDAVFASPECSADNALGVAILAYRAKEKEMDDD